MTRTHAAFHIARAAAPVPAEELGRGRRILAAYAALDPAAARAGGGACCDAVSLELRLQRALRSHALRFEGLSCSELAVLWERERRALAGRTLLALLWVLARQPDAAFRPLEQRVAREVERRAMELVADAPPLHPV